MNANELADELDKSRQEPFTSEYLVGQAATMLRQQQAEIEAFKKEAALQRLSDFTQEAESFDRTASHMAGEYVSYPAKTLTDEEIIQSYADIDGRGIIEFARAILRKAQEK